MVMAVMSHTHAGRRPTKGLLRKVIRREGTMGGVGLTRLAERSWIWRGDGGVKGARTVDPRQRPPPPHLAHTVPYGQNIVCAKEDGDDAEAEPLGLRGGNG